MNVREILFGSAWVVSESVRLTVAGRVWDADEQCRTFNGGVAPHLAEHYVRIVRGGGLPEAARILDMGCGYGRIAMELAGHLGPGQQYFGLDPNAEGIARASAKIGARYPNCTFERVDIRNGAYNPGGALLGRDFRFPFADGSLDLVFMISVLTHVDMETLENYFHEAARTLHPDRGRLVVTAFLLDDEVEGLIAGGKAAFTLPGRHGPSRVQNPAHPERVIAHPRKAVLEILRAAGFAQNSVFDGHWSGRQGDSPMDFQDLLIADRRAGAIQAPAKAPTPKIDKRRFPPGLLARLRALDGRNRLMAFTTWAGSVTMNALWWQNAGWTLAVEDPDGNARPLQLDFTALGRLGLRVAPPEPAPVEKYHPIDDEAMMQLAQEPGHPLSAGDILSCMIASAQNGFVVGDAQRAGARLCLLSPGARRHRVSIPAFAG